MQLIMNTVILYGDIISLLKMKINMIQQVTKFNEKFIKDCCRILRPGGVFGTQSESPEAFYELHIEIVKLLRKIFDFADPFETRLGL